MQEVVGRETLRADLMWKKMLNENDFAAFHAVLKKIGPYVDVRIDYGGDDVRYGVVIALVTLILILTLTLTYASCYALFHDVSLHVSSALETGIEIASLCALFSLPSRPLLPHPPPSVCAAFSAPPHPPPDSVPAPLRASDEAASPAHLLLL